MIDDALHIVSEQLNQFLKLRFALTENMVSLTYIINQDGSVGTEDKNKILFSLVDISEETHTANGSQYRSSNVGEYTVRPDLHLNLQVAFMAYFNPNNYREALKYVSAVIQFFHSKHVFTAQDTPALADKNIQKLVFEMQHMDSNTKNNLWAMIGGKYMPSVVYKVRMITLRDASVQGHLEKIRTMDIDINRKEA